MRTARQLETDAWKAIVNELGIADALRYRVLIDPRQGDYARERDAIFAGSTFDDCLALVKRADVAEPTIRPSGRRARAPKKP